MRTTKPLSEIIATVYKHTRTLIRKARLGWNQVHGEKVLKETITSKSHFIGPIIGGSIFCLIQSGTNVTDDSRSMRVATIAIATAIGAGVGGGAQRMFFPGSTKQPPDDISATQDIAPPTERRRMPPNRRAPPNMQNQQRRKRIPDTFICHANEDKASIARPLRDALREIGINAWLDESEVQIGDSIRNKIDEGLSSCRSATVILSRTFFEKYWTQYEIEGILQRQVRREILLLPVRHGITIEEIRNHSPSLAGIASLNSSEKTVQQIAAEIAKRIRTR